MEENGVCFQRGAEVKRDSVTTSFSIRMLLKKNLLLIAKTDALLDKATFICVIKRISVLMWSLSSPMLLKAFF